MSSASALRCRVHSPCCRILDQRSGKVLRVPACRKAPHALACEELCQIRLSRRTSNHHASPLKKRASSARPFRQRRGRCLLLIDGAIRSFTLVTQGKRARRSGAGVSGFDESNQHSRALRAGGADPRKHSSFEPHSWCVPGRTRELPTANEHQNVPPGSGRRGLQ